MAGPRSARLTLHLVIKARVGRVVVLVGYAAHLSPPFCVTWCDQGGGGRGGRGSRGDPIGGPPSAGVPQLAQNQGREVLVLDLDRFQDVVDVGLVQEREVTERVDAHVGEDGLVVPEPFLDGLEPLAQRHRARHRAGQPLFFRLPADRTVLSWIELHGTFFGFFSKLV